MQLGFPRDTSSIRHPGLAAEATRCYATHPCQHLEGLRCTAVHMPRATDGGDKDAPCPPLRSLCMALRRSHCQAGNRLPAAESLRKYFSNREPVRACACSLQNSPARVAVGQAAETRCAFPLVADVITAHAHVGRRESAILIARGGAWCCPCMPKRCERADLVHGDRRTQQRPGPTRARQLQP